MTGKNVYVTTDYREKQLQRALLQFSRPENANLVREALKKAGREDLIGNGPECLVKQAFGQGSRTQYTPREKSKPAERGVKKMARPQKSVLSRAKTQKKSAHSSKSTKKPAKPYAKMGKR